MDPQFIKVQGEPLHDEVGLLVAGESVVHVPDNACMLEAREGRVLDDAEVLRVESDHLARLLASASIYGLPIRYSAAALAEAACDIARKNAVENA